MLAISLFYIRAAMIHCTQIEGLPLMTFFVTLDKETIHGHIAYSEQ